MLPLCEYIINALRHFLERLAHIHHLRIPSRTKMGDERNFRSRVTDGPRYTMERCRGPGGVPETVPILQLVPIFVAGYAWNILV